MRSLQHTRNSGIGLSHCLIRVHFFAVLSLGHIRDDTLRACSSRAASSNQAAAVPSLTLSFLSREQLFLLRPICRRRRRRRRLPPSSPLPPPVGARTDGRTKSAGPAVSISAWPTGQTYIVRTGPKLCYIRVYVVRVWP